MSTSTAVGIGGNPNAACCSIPPVVSGSYSLKGTYKSLHGFERVYVTGPVNTKTGIICVYDIFGYFPQTQQGADILASALETTVYMPDFFEPDGPFPTDKHPPKTPEDKELYSKFWSGTADLATNKKKLLTFGNGLKADGVEKIGVYGFCWGGKVTMSVGAESIFNAVSIIHPAMLSSDDADKLRIPLAIYPSKDEPVDEYNKIVDIISKKPFASLNDHKLYSNMHHGWAAARADLENPKNKEEFEDVYSRLAEFLKKALV